MSKLVRIQFDNPDRRNALTVDVLEQVAEQATAATDASVLHLCGQGSVFCSGFDMDLVRGQEGALQALIKALSKAIAALRRCPATTVVDVQGAAIAGGCALAMACDVVVARHGAMFGYPVHKFGISPAVTLPVLLPAAGGRARSLLMSGGLLDAAAMEEAGIVHHLLDVDASIEQIIDPLLARGTQAAHVTKQWLNELEGAYEDERFDGPAGLH